MYLCVRNEKGLNQEPLLERSKVKLLDHHGFLSSNFNNLILIINLTIHDYVEGHSQNKVSNSRNLNPTNEVTIYITISKSPIFIFKSLNIHLIPNAIERIFYLPTMGLITLYFVIVRG